MNVLYYPRQIVLVTCKGTAEILGKEQEKHDIVAICRHSPASNFPELYVIFLNKKLMAVELIRSSGVFAVNFMPHSEVGKIEKVMKVSGEFSEKVEALGFHEGECEKIDCFCLAEAAGWIECELFSEQEIGDSIMFIGKVVNSRLEKVVNRAFHFGGDEFGTTR